MRTCVCAFCDFFEGPEDHGRLVEEDVVRLHKTSPGTGGHNSLLSTTSRAFPIILGNEMFMMVISCIDIGEMVCCPNFFGTVLT